MPQQDERYDFRALLTELDCIDEWLTDLGFTSRDRVRQYQVKIRQALEAEEAGTIEQLQAGASLAEARQFFWSYIDADEFVRALNALRSIPDLDLTAELERALRGPVDLLAEDRDSNDGRNIMFELVVGGRLAAAGLRPTFGAMADVSAKFAATTVSIECKRPLTSHGIEKAISKAASKLRACPDGLRLIALSVSRLLNSGDPFSVPVVSTTADALPWVQDRVDGLLACTRRWWARDRVGADGFYCYAFLPMKTSAGIYFPCRYDVLAPAERGGLKHDLLRWFVQAINQIG